MTKGFWRFCGLWLPVFIQVGIIFFYSSQPSGSESLESFPLPAGIGHFGGYGLLGLLLYRALAGNWNRWVLRAAVLTVLIATVYGVWDEYYQSFIPGRESTLVDVAIDGAGALTAVLAVWVWNKLRRKRETNRHPT